MRASAFLLLFISTNQFFCSVLFQPIIEDKDNIETRHKDRDKT